AARAAVATAVTVVVTTAAAAVVVAVARGAGFGGGSRGRFRGLLTATLARLPLLAVVVVGDAFRVLLDVQLDVLAARDILDHNRRLFARRVTETSLVVLERGRGELGHGEDAGDHGQPGADRDDPAAAFPGHGRPPPLSISPLPAGE